MAKTQYSLSDDPKKAGTRRRVSPSPCARCACRAGAGFVVAFTGDIIAMPGPAQGSRRRGASTWTKTGKIVGIVLKNKLEAQEKAPACRIAAGGGFLLGGGAARVLRREWRRNVLPRGGGGVRRKGQALRGNAVRKGQPFRHAAVRQLSPSHRNIPLECPGCCAWLIRIREHTVLSYPKRSCFRFYDHNSFILFAVRPAKKGGAGAGGAGGPPEAPRPLFRYSCSDWARQRRA